MAEPFRRPSLRAASTDGQAEGRPAPVAVLDPRPAVLVVARHNLLALIVAGILGGVAGLVLSQLQSPTYSATGRLFLVDPNRDFGLDPGQAPYTDPLRNTRTRAQLVESAPVFRRVARSLGTTVDDVRDRVDVLPARESDLVTITAEAGSAEEAESLVGLVQRQYEVVAASAQQAPYRSAIEQVIRSRREVLADLRRVNAALEASPGSTRLLAERALLQEHYRFLRDREATLTANAGLLGSGVQLAERPVAEPDAVTPRPIRNAAIGGMLGVVLLLGLLWWRAGGMPVAGSVEVVESTLGVPLLAELRAPSSRRGRRTLDDALDALAATVASAAGARVILVTPTTEADRQTSLPLWLAQGLEHQRRVVVVDASGTGALSENIGGSGAPGLSEVGDDGTSTLRLVRSVELQAGSSVPVLGTGRRPDAFDRAARLSRALTELRDAVDTVVVDAPAGGSVATVVAPGTQSVGIVVVRPATPLAAVTGMRRELAVLGVRPLGFVFVRGRLTARMRRRQRR